MKKSVFWIITPVLLLFILGLFLLIKGYFEAPSFLTFSGFLMFLFFGLYYRGEISLLKILGNEVRFIENAKQDIQEYLADIYKSHLLTIAAYVPIHINPGETKAANVDTLFEVYEKLKKYDLVPKAKTELQQAAETVISNQLSLLTVYAQHQAQYEGLESLPAKLADLEENKSFENWPDHINVPIQNREPLYNETLAHLKTVEGIISKASQL